MRKRRLSTDIEKLERQLREITSYHHCEDLSVIRKLEGSLSDIKINAFINEAMGEDYHDIREEKVEYEYICED